MPNSDLSFYYVKLSCPDSTEDQAQNNSFLDLMEKVVTNQLISGYQATNIPYALDDIGEGDIIFVHIGGDHSKKSRYFKTSQHIDNYENGIYAIALLQSVNSTQKTITIDIYPFKSHVTKSDLYLFPQFLDNLGCATKGIPNQAGLYKLSTNQAYSFIEYIDSIGSLGLSSEIIKNINFDGSLIQGFEEYSQSNPDFTKRKANKLIAQHLSGKSLLKKNNEKKGYTNNNTSTISKPFLLLAGISGTGKTRFVREQAKTSGQFTETYSLTSVRPDWHEPSDLLGYISRLNGAAEYITTDVLQFIARAWRAIADSNLTVEIQESKDLGKRLVVAGERDVLAQVLPYWLCLDEMNLAPVEQYFADYLSVLETREWYWTADSFTYSCDALLKPATIKEVADKEKLRKELGFDGAQYDELWAHICQYGLGIPFNLLVAGTVNMDETTHGFSRKVIDRALSFDFGAFFPNDYNDFFTPTSCNKRLSYPIWSNASKADLADTLDVDGTKTVAFLSAVNAVLKNTPFELAFRALNELLLAVASSRPKDDLTLQAVWDDFMMCKVLPRIEGDTDKLTTLDGKALLGELSTVLADQLAPIWLAPATNEANQRPDLYREKIVDDGATDEEKVLRIPCRSKAKLKWMSERLASATFTSFWP